VRMYQPDVMTTYNEFGGYGHPDHIRTHLVAVGAFERAGDAAWYPEQLAPEHGGTGPAPDEGGVAPWTPSKLYEQAIPASVRHAMAERLKALGQRSFWEPPEDATPEQVEEFEAFASKMLVPDESVTTWLDISGAPVDAKWAAIHEHVSQISDESPFMLMGIDGWRESWSSEAYILRESRIPTSLPETDLFAGIA
jgi:mycothiol S-conjugate amidase